MNKIFSENYVAAISVFWIVIMASLIILKRATLNNLGLNEIGDALAGAFAPLGFFWLVAGFYQQGKGLEQNSEALKIQVQELSNSTNALNAQVAEQQKLLDATNNQIEINVKKNNFDIFAQKKQFQPFFHINNLKIHNFTFGNSKKITSIEIEINITNSRAMCRTLFFTYNYEGESAVDLLIKHKTIQLLNNMGETGNLCLDIKNFPEFDDQEKSIMVLRISYTDALDTIQYQCVFLYLKQNMSGHIVLDRYQMGEQTLY